MTNFISDFGYDSVKLPKEGINPFVLLRKGDEGVDRIGSLSNTIIETEQNKFPHVLESPTADFKGKRYLQTNFDLGINILKNLLANLDISAAGLEIIFQRARNISFAVNDTISSRVDLLNFESFLNHPNIKETINEIIANQGTVYIITEILKTNTFSVEAQDENNKKIALNIPGVDDIIKGGINMSNSSEKQNNLEITGKNKLTYGYKAVKIERVETSGHKFWQKANFKYILKPITGLNLNE